MSYDNGSNWCPWGDPCDLTIIPQPQVGQRAIDDKGIGSMSIFPNPYASGALSMKVSAEQSGSGSVSIMTIDGAEVHAQQVFISEGEQLIELQLSGSLAHGTYIVQLFSGGSVHTQRLLVH